MRFSAPVKVKAEVKSPVFIWDGDTIKPLSFVVDGDLVHVLDIERFMRALSDRERQAYLAWLEPILNEIARLDDRIQHAKESRNEELRRHLDRQKRNKAAELAMERFLKDRLGKSPATFVRQADCIAYSVRWMVKPGDDGFRGFIKSAGRHPYIPGTEIKGALRTSLLFALLADDHRYAALRQEVDQVRHVLKSGKSPKEKIRRLEKVAGAIEGQFFRPAGQSDPKKSDAKYDLLRLVQITDSELLLPDALRIRVSESVGTRRFTKTLAESIEPGNSFTFQLALGAQDASWALDELGLLPLARERLSVARLFEACYQRSAAVLEMEAEYFDEPAIVKQIKELQAANKPDAPLLRLGTGQGFLSVTVDLRVRKRDGALYEAIREGVSLQRRWRTVPGNFPKTRRTVSDGRGNPLMLAGWIKLTQV